MDKRRIVQVAAAIVTNLNYKGFLEGNIYRGKLKKLCVPGLNCYSCPGALGACPIGALQAVAGSVKYGFSMYAAGFIALIGILSGRLVCGWICPFGLFQELLGKIPGCKVKVSGKANNVLKYMKYIVLAVFVLLLPAVLADEFGLSTPYFCEYICPAGALEGGIPLVLMNEPLRETIGFLFAWKQFVLIVVIIASILIYRPFCRYLCPLGAFYSIFNKISFYRYTVDKTRCTNCNTCSQKCKMNLMPDKNPNDSECIRCGCCVKACPSEAISQGRIL